MTVTANDDGDDNAEADKTTIAAPKTSLGQGYEKKTLSSLHKLLVITAR